MPKALNVETTVIDGIDVGTVHKTDERNRPPRAHRRRAAVRRSAHPSLAGQRVQHAQARRRHHRYRLGVERQRRAGKSPRLAQGHDPILNYVRELEERRRQPRRDRKPRRSSSQQADAAARFALESPLPEPRRRSTMLSPEKEISHAARNDFR